MTQASPRPTQPDSQRPPRSPAEWVTFGLASLILTTIAGLVIYAGVTQEDRPPAFTVDRTEIRESQGQFYIPYEITNSGGDTVESVQVVAELRVNGQLVESGDQQFDFLSAGEKESGAFIFSRDPRQGDLRVRVASYKLP